MVVPICLPSEQAVGLTNFKKKLEGPGPIGLDLLEISNIYFLSNGSIFSLNI